jgi:glycosyltransferase involved in cell wall biosynthesis
MVGTGELHRLFSDVDASPMPPQVAGGLEADDAGTVTSAGAKHTAELGKDAGAQDGQPAGMARSLQPAREPDHYGGDLFSEVERYARRVSELALSRTIDLVHAHDWLTWPAGMAVARERGVPLVVHAHSLEYDRSGAHPNPRIFEIERAGLRAADRVIAVSYYTRGIIHREHGIPLDRIAVVHNGVYTQAEIQSYRSRQPGSPRKTVLFLGRVTFQKGPEYFVQAAAKVVPHVPDVEFVVAGSGDMLPTMIEQVAALGLGRYFHFTGFLKGPEVERTFSMADLYVMPSVSEPFGISALEAMSYDTPVIISKQSGVSELLQHALKVDFWDVDYLANLMIGALLYPELRADIVGMGRDEVRRIHWDAAAEAAAAVYRDVIEAS